MSQKKETTRQHLTLHSTFLDSTITMWPESEVPNHTQARINNTANKEYNKERKINIPFQPIYSKRWRTA